MNQNGRDKSFATLLIVGAVIVGLIIIGGLTDWFGLLGIETPPGETTPPNNPT